MFIYKYTNYLRNRIWPLIYRFYKSADILRISYLRTIKRSFFLDRAFLWETLCIWQYYVIQKYILKKIFKSIILYTLFYSKYIYFLIQLLT